MKIKRILIANRGEIAVRIMRTARRMGIECVAIRTQAEPDAMYLSSADIVHEEDDTEAVIPVSLDIEKLISVASEQKFSSARRLTPYTRWATRPSPGR